MDISREGVNLLIRDEEYQSRPCMSSVETVPDSPNPCLGSYWWYLTRVRYCPALYRGTQRTRTVDVIIDGILVITWTSSGATDEFQRIGISGESGQVIEIRGVLPDEDSWLSITEASSFRRHLHDFV